MSARLVRNLLAALIGLVLGMVAHQSFAATYQYTYNGAYYQVQDSLSCAAVAEQIVKFFNNINFSQNVVGASGFTVWSPQDCARPFVATVGDTVSITLQKNVVGTGLGSFTANATLTSIHGTVSDEAPESQLLIALMCCLGFSLGVIAGQQR